MSTRETLVDAVALALRGANGYGDLKDLAYEGWSKIAFLVAGSAMGLELNGATDTDSLGYAIGRKIEDETGIKLGNVFDGESLKTKLERAGIQAIYQAAGIDGVASREGLAEAFKTEVRKKINERVAGADIAGLFEPSATAVSMYQAILKRRTEKTLLQTPKAAKNRERQARYRQGHKRVAA